MNKSNSSAHVKSNGQPTNKTDNTGMNSVTQNAWMGNSQNNMNTENSMFGLALFAATPFLTTYFPDEIVSQLKNKYLAKLYEITQVKVAAGPNDYKYIIRWQENGIHTSEAVHKQGTVVPM